MKKTVILIITTILLNLSFYSCTDPCGKDSGAKYDLKIKSIEALVGKYNSETFTTKNLEPYQSVAIKLAVKETSQIPISQINFGLISSAYACSPVWPSPTQKLAAISIISDKKMENIDAGKDIASLFGVSKGYDFSEIKEYISYENNFGYDGESLFFQLLKAPSESIENHDITITLTMDDGEIYEAVAKGFNVEVNPSTKS